MSFYRTLLAAVAAVAIASPVFAADTTEGQDATMQPTTETTTTTTTAQAGDQGAKETKVNMNKATAKDLMKVKGLTAGKAKAIVAYRKKHGDFKTTDDLANVKGFKKMNAEALKGITDQLTVE